MKTLRLLLLGPLLTFGAIGLAQPPASSEWADPTRPPVMAAAEGASAPRPARAASAPAAPQLQSVQVGGAAPSALVDGRIVEVGDALGAMHVVAIDTEGLTLRNAAGRTERMLLISASIAKREGASTRPVAALAGAQSAEGRRP